MAVMHWPGLPWLASGLPGSTGMMSLEIATRQLGSDPRALLMVHSVAGKRRVVPAGVYCSRTLPTAGAHDNCPELIYSWRNTRHKTGGWEAE